MSNKPFQSAIAAAFCCSSLPIVATADLSFTHLDTYTEACVDESCAEISAYDPTTSRVFITNAEENELRILEIDANRKFVEITAIDLSPYGGGPNSVAVKNGVVAVAVEADVKTDNGTVELFDTNGNHQNTIAAGALPDMLTFTPDGNYLLVANEGEPNDNYDVDPEGSVTIIDTSSWLPATADFSAFNGAKLKDVRVYGPNASVAQDLEPEYIAVSADSRTAWISLQENNALAKLDIASATITDVYGLGYKKHQQRRNAFDASNEDGGINIQPWPTRGMYQPDAIVSYQRGNADFILSANEGDARDYNGYSEEERVKDLTLDPKVFRNADDLQEESNLGRLKTTTANGDEDGDGEYEAIYSYGARSFSIWNNNGKQVYDSGSEFEKRLEQFENNGEDVWVDSRSDDKGPEPESITVGEIGGEHYAFIGLERVSGIFVYKISHPAKPVYEGYLNTKSYGDISPEGLTFIPVDSSSGWLLVSNEVSNTTSLYEIAVSN
jgi:hypothetical protein